MLSARPDDGTETNGEYIEWWAQWKMYESSLHCWWTTDGWTKRKNKKLDIRKWKKPIWTKAISINHLPPAERIFFPKQNKKMLASDGILVCRLRRSNLCRVIYPVHRIVSICGTSESAAHNSCSTRITSLSIERSEPNTLINFIFLLHYLLPSALGNRIISISSYWITRIQMKFSSFRTSTFECRWGKASTHHRNMYIMKTSSLCSGFDRTSKYMPAAERVAIIANSLRLPLEFEFAFVRRVRTLHGEHAARTQWYI